MSDRVSEKFVTKERERGDIFNIIIIFLFTSSVSTVELKI